MNNQTVKEKPDGLSVVICCHNSASRLPRTLSHLLNQNLPDSCQWEVLVIDNASTDDTAEAARQYWPHANPISLRVVEETKVGLANARIRGIHEARYEIIVFVDDDNWLEASYLSIAYSIMSEHPDVGACGGLGSASFEELEPDWFGQFQSTYAVGPQGAKAGEVDISRGYLFGAGLTLRRSQLLCMLTNGFQFLNIGRSGKHLGAGDDTEICFALGLSGWKLWYDPAMRFEHFMPANRMSIAHLHQTHSGFGTSAPILDAYRVLLNKKLRFRRIRQHWIGATLYYVMVFLINILVAIPLQLTPKRLAIRLTLASHYSRILRIIVLKKHYNHIVDGLRKAPWRKSCAPT